MNRITKHFVWPLSLCLLSAFSVPAFALEKSTSTPTEVTHYGVNKSKAPALRDGSVTKHYYKGKMVTHHGKHCRTFVKYRHYCKKVHHCFWRHGHKKCYFTKVCHRYPVTVTKCYHRY